MLRERTSRKTWLIGTAAAVVAAATALALLWPHNKPEPRPREYTTATACLLTPAAGIADHDAAPIWDGMRRASQSTHGKIRYLAVTGDQTPTNAATYLATLALSGCNLILAAGPAPTAAINTNAATYPKAHFVIVGTAKTQTNVAQISDTDPAGTTKAIQALVDDALNTAN